LCDAGPVVRLTRYNVWAVARYQEVYDVLNDWRTYSSARGVGLADFKKERPWRMPSLLLEADPPLHDRTRKVLDEVLSPAAVRTLRARFAAAADQLMDNLLVRGSFEGDCVLSALARKATSIEITGPIERRFNNTMRGLASLPVTMRAA
jgi:4-methoxybenzoate monooxygenase (O-demethylating)